MAVAAWAETATAAEVLEAAMAMVEVEARVVMVMAMMMATVADMGGGGDGHGGGGDGHGDGGNGDDGGGEGGRSQGDEIEGDGVKCGGGVSSLVMRQGPWSLGCRRTWSPTPGDLWSNGCCCLQRRRLRNRRAPQPIRRCMRVSKRRDHA